nr:hypothetical protein [Eubacterium sp.]
MKKTVMIFVVIILLLIGGLFIYDNLPMYIKNEAIFKGYSDYDGRECIGIDADIYYVYYYSEKDIEKFADSDLYTEVYYAQDIFEIKKVIKQFEEYGNVKNFSNSVSVGDYY